MKKKGLYLVIERVDYEQDNIWIVSADNETEAIEKVCETYSPCSWKLDATRLSSTSDYTENEIVYTL